MQNPEEIKSLLDKYWSGETTLDEERALKRYFNGPMVAQQLRPMIPLFQTLGQEQNLRSEHSYLLPPLTQRPAQSHWAMAAAIAALLAIGGWWMFGSPPMPEVAVTPPPAVPAVPTPMPTAPAVTPVPAPAPVLAEQSTPVKKAAVKRKKLAPVALDPEAELAMEEIKAALALVSSKLNKGKKAAIKDLDQLENMDKFFKPKSDG